MTNLIPITSDMPAEVAVACNEINQFLQNPTREILFNIDDVFYVYKEEEIGELVWHVTYNYESIGGGGYVFKSDGCWYTRAIWSGEDTKRDIDGIGVGYDMCVGIAP